MGLCISRILRTYEQISDKEILRIENNWVIYSLKMKDIPLFKQQNVMMNINSKCRNWSITNILIGIDEESDNKLQELTLNTIFKLMYAIEKKWTKKQRETILYMLVNNVNQLDTSKHFDVSASNIHQIITKGNFNAYKESFINLKEIMNEVYHYVKF